MAFAKLDITGRRFGRLIAISPTDEREGTSVVWLCQCSCGNQTKVAVSGLQRNMVSCGCHTKKIPGSKRLPRRGQCICGGISLRPLKTSPMWVCLKCGVGRIGSRPDSAVYINPDDVAEALSLGKSQREQECQQATTSI